MIEPERTTEFKKAIKKHLKEVDKKFNLGLFEKYQGQEGISKLAGEVYAMREIYDMMYEQFRTQKPESAKFMSDDIRKDTRTHIRLEADGDGYVVTNLEDKPVRLSLEEAKKIVRFKDNPSRVGRIKLKGDGSELTKTEEESGSVYYHGTKEKFTKFSAEKASEEKFRKYGPGVYLCAKKQTPSNLQVKLGMCLK